MKGWRGITLPMPGMKRYVLAADGRTPVECDDILVWAKWFETASRLVRRTYFVFGSEWEGDEGVLADARAAWLLLGGQGPVRLDRLPGRRP